MEKTFDNCMEYLENYKDAKQENLKSLDVLSEAVKFNSIKQEVGSIENCLCVIDNEVNEINNTLQEVIQEKQDVQIRVNFICNLIAGIISDKNKENNDNIKVVLQNIIDDNYIKNI